MDNNKATLLSKFNLQDKKNERHEFKIESIKLQMIDLSNKINAPDEKMTVFWGFLNEVK